MPFVSEASPLESYNSLCDRHLVNFFRSARIRKHLLKTGLIRENGEIRPESEYRELRMRENQKRALLELIAQSIVERSLEAERVRQGKIRRTLEEICKLHRVRQIKEERRKRESETLLMQLIPRSPRSRDKLDPLPIPVTDPSVLLNSGAICIPVSDIDEPDLAVMDRRSRLEVAKLRRIYNKQRNRERKAGQPPYLYLYGQRRISRSRRVGNKTKKDNKRSDSFGDGTSNQPCAPSKEPEQLHGNQGDRNEVNERSTKRPNSSVLTNRSTPTDAHPSPATLSKTEREAMRRILSNSLPNHKAFDKHVCAKHVTQEVTPSLMFSSKLAPQAVLLQHRGPPIDLAHGYALRSRPPDEGKEVAATHARSVEHKPPIIIPKPARSQSDDEEQASVGSSLPPITDNQNLLKSPCVVKLAYLGCSRLEDRPSGARVKRNSQLLAGKPSPKRLITVFQQPSGANTVAVFKGILKAGDVFEFTSRRVHGFPFSLSLCIDGTQDARVSTCCEYRHKKGTRIGGKNGHFVLMDVQGSTPCNRCQNVRMAKQDRMEHRKPQQKKHIVAGDVKDESHLESVADLKDTKRLAPTNAVADTLLNRDPVGSNINRRLAKSTRWECFQTAFGVEQPEEPKEQAKELKYGVEEYEDADEVEPLSDTHESVSHLLPATESENSTESPSEDAPGTPDAADDLEEYSDEDFCEDEVQNDPSVEYAGSSTALELRSVRDSSLNVLKTWTEGNCVSLEKVDAVLVGCTTTANERNEEVCQADEDDRTDNMFKTTQVEGEVFGNPHLRTSYDYYIHESTEQNLMHDSGVTEAGNLSRSGDKNCIAENNILKLASNYYSNPSPFTVKKEVNQDKAAVCTEIFHFKPSEESSLEDHSKTSPCVTTLPSTTVDYRLKTLSTTLASSKTIKPKDDPSETGFDSGVHFGDCAMLYAPVHSSETGPNHISVVPSTNASFSLPERTTPNVLQSPERNVPQIAREQIPLTQSPLNLSVTEETSETAGRMATQLRREDWLRSKTNLILTPTSSTDALASSEYEQALDIYESASETTLRSPFIPTGFKSSAKSESDVRRSGFGTRNA